MELRIFVVLSVMCSYASSQIVSYFVNKSKTYADAQKYCRENHIDLVTLKNQADVDELFTRENFEFTESTWIGLSKGSSKTWRWSLDDKSFYKDEEYKYRNWASSEQTVEFADCATMAADGQFYDMYCFPPRCFICYDDQASNAQKFVLVLELRSWRDAQSYCRQHYTDLASVKNKDDNRQMQQMITPGYFVFIGLFRDAYFWSDNGTSSLRNWDFFQPAGVGACVAQQLHNSRLWDDQKCSSQRPFFCSALLKKRQIVKIEVKSPADVSHALVKAAILAKLKQKLEELGMGYDTMEWKSPAV